MVISAYYVEIMYISFDLNTALNLTLFTIIAGLNRFSAVSELESKWLTSNVIKGNIV